MGCDIHIYVEKKNEDGSWDVVKGRNPRIDMYRSRAKYVREKGDIEHAKSLEHSATTIESGELLKKELQKLEESYPKEERENDPELLEEYESELASVLNYDSPACSKGWIYYGRNYDLFAILANVRNGFGFAGVDTGEGFFPISIPKGLPSDASDFVKKEAERWDGDGHSHSYFSVKELLKYDWNQTTTQRGIVSESEYKTYKEKGYPDSYAGGVGGSSTVQLTNKEMEMLLKGVFLRKEDASYYTQVSWHESYHEATGEFYTKSLPALQELAQENLEDVRIVFWFDK